MRRKAAALHRGIPSLHRSDSHHPPAGRHGARAAFRFTGRRAEVCDRSGSRHFAWAALPQASAEGNAGDVPAVFLCAHHAPAYLAVAANTGAPRKASAIRSRASSAAALPMSGFAPAPRPVLPNWITWVARERASACASVFITMKSTPWTPRLIMCCTALPPAPPTPTTLMIVPLVSVSSISKSILPPSRMKIGVIRQEIGQPLVARQPPAPARILCVQKFPRNQSFMRPKTCPIDPDCTATLRPRMRCERPSTSKPIAVE